VLLRRAWCIVRAVTLPAVRRHPLRAGLTLAGVLVGVQMAVAVAVIHRSVVASFERTVAAIAGSAALQVANGSVGVPEALVEPIAAVPGVASASALIQDTVATSAGDLTILGFDLLADQAIRLAQLPRAHVHIADELRFVNATDSIALSSSFAARAEVELGDRLAVSAPSGEETLVVRGLLDPVGPVTLFGGAVGLVDLPTAQRLLARGPRVDQIDVALAPGIDLAAAATALRQVVDGSGVVGAPREHGMRLGNLLTGVQAIFAIVSLLAVLVGAFIVYHTLDAAVAQRRRALALARSLGCERRAAFLAVALEALVYGVAGALGGALLGLAAADAAIGLVTAGVGAIWARTDVAHLTLEARDLLPAFGLGIGGALLAALAPARRAAGVSLVAELGTDTSSGRGTQARTFLGGLLLGLVGFGILLAPLELEGFQAQVAVVVAGGALMAVGGAVAAPTLASLLGRAVQALSGGLRAPLLQLASERLVRSPAAHRGVLAGLMAAFSLVLVVGSFVRSLRVTIIDWVDQVVAADLHVSPTLQLPLPAGPTLPGALEQDLRALPGVAGVSATRMVHVQVGERLVILRAQSADAFDRDRRPLVEGRADDVRPALLAGEAVLISDNLAYRDGLGAGERLTLATPSGPRTFRIAAIVADYTLDTGTIIMARDAYTAIWQDEQVNEYLLWTAPGTDLAAVRDAVGARLRGRVRATVFSGRDFHANIVRALDDALLLTDAIQVVAVGIAIVGVVNFFLAAVVDRRREIALLRSIALTRAQMVRLFTFESALLGLAGGTLAVLLAWPTAYATVTQSAYMVSGWVLAFRFPFDLTVATVAGATLTAAGAAVLPARRAAAWDVGRASAPRE